MYTTVILEKSTVHNHTDLESEFYANDCEVGGVCLLGVRNCTTSPYILIVYFTLTNYRRKTVNCLSCASDHFSVKNCDLLSSSQLSLAV